MKIFLAIIASIIVISALIIGYLYNQFTYQPEYFQAIEEIESSQIKDHTRAVKNRIIKDMEQEGRAKLDGEDIMLLTLNQLSQETDLDFAGFISKSTSEMKNGKLRTEAIINLKALSEQNMSAEDRKDFDAAMRYIPDVMAGEIYIAVEATPVKKKGTLYLADDLVFSIGDFEQSIPEVKQNRDLRIELSELHKAGISDIIVHDNYIEIVK